MVSVLKPSIMLGQLYDCADSVRKTINSSCSDVEPWALVAGSVVTTAALAWLYDFSSHGEESVRTRATEYFFYLAKKLPVVRDKVAKELKKTKYDLQKGMVKDFEGMSFITKLPVKSWSEEEVLAKTKEYNGLGKFDWLHGRLSGAVYNYTQNLADLTSKVYGMCSYTNPLHSDVFPGVRKMESEVVRMTCTLFNGGDESCGCMTSGGTESILLACKAYRDRAISLGVKRPEIIKPVTAHAAFDKAAKLMRMRIKQISVDPVTLKVNLKEMRRAISRNTCMLVGSAPEFPHGIIDDIEEIAKMGEKYNIPVHVDACLGGFLLPFMQKAGFPLPPFDFRLPGVTSISADTHKYGSAPKGSSVIMYRDESYRNFQYFVVPNWPGGVYASPAMPGSRPGGIIASCWATMMYIGEEGYIENTRKIITTARKIEEGLKKIPKLKIMGQPQMSVISFGTDDFDIYRLSEALMHKGWNLNALQFPPCVHVCVTMMHTYDNVVEMFLKDVSDCTTEILQNPSGTAAGMGAVYGLAQTIPDRSLVSDMIRLFLDAGYITKFPDENF